MKPTLTACFDRSTLSAILPHHPRIEQDLFLPLFILYWCVSGYSISHRHTDLNASSRLRHGVSRTSFNFQALLKLRIDNSVRSLPPAPLYLCLPFTILQSQTLRLYLGVSTSRHVPFVFACTSWLLLKTCGVFFPFLISRVTFVLDFCKMILLSDFVQAYVRQLLAVHKLIVLVIDVSVLYHSRYVITERQSIKRLNQYQCTSTDYYVSNGLGS